MSDDMKVSKGLVFPVVALPGVGAHARQVRRRARGRAGVLCGGEAGYAEVGDWYGWGWGFWKKTEAIKTEFSRKRRLHDCSINSGKSQCRRKS